MSQRYILLTILLPKSYYFYHLEKDPIIVILRRIHIYIQDLFAQRSKWKPQQEAGVLNPLKAKSVGLFFSAGTKSELNRVREVVRDIQQTFGNAQVIIYNANRETPDVIAERNYFMFSPDDFTISWKKKKDLSDWYREHYFELLINFDKGDDPVKNALFSEMKAGFKIGPYKQEQKDLYNMMIDFEECGVNHPGFFKHVLHYLTVLNIT